MSRVSLLKDSIVAQTLLGQMEDAAERSEAWADGTEPGGPDTKSSREHAEDSESSAKASGEARDESVAARNRSSEWAAKEGAPVSNGDVQAGEVGDNEYSAKEHAIGDAVPTGSAKAHASGSVPTGSAKRWASAPEDEEVADEEYSAKHYAKKAAADREQTGEDVTATDALRRAAERAAAIAQSVPGVSNDSALAMAQAALLGIIVPTSAYAVNEWGNSAIVGMTGSVTDRLDGTFTLADEATWRSNWQGEPGGSSASSGRGGLSFAVPVYAGFCEVQLRRDDQTLFSWNSGEIPNRAGRLPGPPGVLVVEMTAARLAELIPSGPPAADWEIKIVASGPDGARVGRPVVQFQDRLAISPREGERRREFSTVSGSRAVQLSDLGRVLRATSAGVTITLPNTLGDGFHCEVVAATAPGLQSEVVQFAAGSGASIVGGRTRLDAQGRVARLVYHAASSTWYPTGDVVA